MALIFRIVTPIEISDAIKAPMDVPIIVFTVERIFISLSNFSRTPQNEIPFTPPPDNIIVLYYLRILIVCLLI